jgi:hypothetical protein
MKVFARKSGFAWLVRYVRILLALAVLVFGLALSPAPSFADVFDPLYSRYNYQLLVAYVLGIIPSSTTVRQLWLGDKPSLELLEIEYSFFQLLALTANGPAPLAVPAATTGQYTLSSSTPILPFAGNQLVVSGAALFANNTNLSAVTLRRQGDCTLVEDIFEPVNNLLTPTSVDELPGAQDYLHMLSGLTTTPDVFPLGCAEPTLGKTAVFTVEPVGVTANNLDLTALLTANGALVVQEIDTTTNATSTVTLATGEIAAFTVVDVNGDGLNDIVASNVIDPATQNPSFATFLNNGDGSFAKPSYVDGAGLVMFTVDDVNGDGNPDIVFTSVQFGDAGPVFTVTTLPGNGDGTFNAGVSSAASAGGGSSFVTADFNGDGKKDLLYGNRVMLGNGDGTFAEGPSLPALVQRESGNATSAEVGDFNQDGNLDIVYSGSGIVQILLGKGDGTFQVGARYASLTPTQPVTVTDIDGDGNLDIFVGNSSQGLYAQDSNDNLSPMMQVLFGRGDGTFVGAPVYSQTPVSTFVSADFNGDNQPDLLLPIANSDGGLPGSLNLLPGDGAGNFGAAVTSTVNLAPMLIAAADMNHDGKPDAVMAGRGLAGSSNAGPLLSVLLNLGNGTFGGQRDYPVPGSPASLAVGDFNGDGLPDVAVGMAPRQGASGGGVYVLLGQSDGTLGPPVMIDASLNPTSLAAGDLNGDGRTDLVIADQGFFSSGSDQVNGALHVYLGNPDGTFTAAGPPLTSATYYGVVGLGDLNEDGKLDLIAGGYVPGTDFGGGTSNVYTLIGNGDGTFGSAQITPLAGADGFGAQTLALGDFNGDGILDVAAGNPNDYTEVLLGLGDGTFAGSLLSLGQQPLDLGAVDLNGDGLAELLIGGASGLAVFNNAGPWPTLSPTTASDRRGTAGPRGPSAALAGNRNRRGRGLFAFSLGTRLDRGASCRSRGSEQ